MKSQSLTIPDKPEETSLLTPDEFRALAARLAGNTRRAAAIAGGWMASMMVWALIWTWALWSGNSIFLLLGLPLVLAWRLANYLNDRHLRLTEQKVERLIEFVATTQDVNMLGPILDLQGTWGAPNNFSVRSRPAIEAAVARLLPLVQTTNADGLTTSQRATLRRLLLYSAGFSETRSNADFALLALSALERIGDKRDLPDVERLMKAGGLSDEIRAAATRCAQTINERLAHEKVRDVLLRADRKPEAVQTLLRSSTANANTPPQQLLRAATSNDTDTPA